MHPDQFNTALPARMAELEKKHGTKPSAWLEALNSLYMEGREVLESDPRTADSEAAFTGLYEKFRAKNAAVFERGLQLFQADPSREAEMIGFFEGSKKYSLIAAMKTPRSLQAILAAIRNTLTEPYFRVRSAPYRALWTLSDSLHARAEVQTFLRESFEVVRKKSKEPNYVAYWEIALALAHFGDPSFFPTLEREFLRVTDDGLDMMQAMKNPLPHELKCCVGALALAHACLGNAAFAPKLRKWAEDRDNERSFSQDYGMMVRYALWTMEKDAGSAAAQLEDEDRGAWYAAAALADMGAKNQTSAIEKSLGGKLRPPVKLALKEAVRRLELARPATDRMIWMLGLENPLELAQGLETVNAFVEAAKGDVERHEADDAMAEDREES